MGKKLVIVESPAKAKTINKILGQEFVVKSSMGHVRDLPVKSLGVDMDRDFEPKYVIVTGRQKIIADLKKSAKNADAIYLAPDPDREGEAIAWHLREVLKSDGNDGKFLRIQYNEITPRAVRKAFDSPGELDFNRVDAQQARRILDRIVGYKVSPLLWRRIKRGLSAGRVQTVALRLVCEREKEIIAFVPEKYWILGAVVKKLVAPVDPFRLKLMKISDKKAEVKDEKQAVSIVDDIKGRTFRVKEIAIRTVTRRAAPPYITSTLQQACSSYCGYSPKRTMGIAQKLYEGVDIDGETLGLITYMRTDSFNIANEAREECRNFIRGEYGDKFCPEKPNFFKSRSSAQEAHEAIRPTSVDRTPEKLSRWLNASEMNVYKLIWRRFVASQMSPSEIDQRTVKVEVLPPDGRKDYEEYLFQATSSEVRFPGYMKVLDQESDKKNDDEDEKQVLPELKEGEDLECIELLKDEKETTPPQRYSEASLVKALESNGVGRPSTYAQIVGTLNDRKYTTREKKSLIPTELGMKVSDFLSETMDELFNVKFTASMEDRLDDVERGTTGRVKMLSDFYSRFSEWMEKVKPESADAGLVMKVLNLLDGVKDWAPEVQVGKRKYNDHKFVDSIRKQLEKKDGRVSERQYGALLEMACKYKEQLPEVENVLKAIGAEDVLKKPSVQPPCDSTKVKLALFDGVTMDQSASDFIASLKSQVERGRRLSNAQIRVLDSILVNHSKQIENFDAMKAELNIGTEEVADDNESGPLLGAMEGVTSWKEPVQRGKRLFDDRAFYESLKGHFDSKGRLSDRQRAALKKMVKRYRGQIPDYDSIAEKCGIAPRKDGGN